MGCIMARMGLDKNAIIYRAAQLANDVGIENITLKSLANDLNIQPPSLYNHISGLDDLKKELMIYGWHQMEEQIIESVAGISGYDAIEAICRSFLEYATTNPGVFNAMLWYNKFENDEAQNATTKLFSVVFKIFSSLNISQENSDHLCAWGPIPAGSAKAGVWRPTARTPSPSATATATSSTTATGRR